MPYIGNQHNVGDHVNNFKVLDDISSYTATFDGSASSVVIVADETIRIPEHRFIQGQRVVYNNGGGSNIGGLSSGTAYYVSFDSANTIKLATSLANANSNTVINLSVTGGGTSHTLTASFDGVNTKFKLTHGNGKAARLNNATQLNVAINNVIQRPNVSALTFTEGFALEDNHKIVFKTAPTVDDIFWGSIIANTIENFDLKENEVNNFTGDGSTTEFTLSSIPANNESVVVTVDGVLQHPSDSTTARAYTLIDSVLQFTAAPALNAEIQVRHIGFAGASTNDVSGFYGRTGNVSLTANDHITTGDITARNFNATGITTFGTANFSGSVSIGGTLTYEDVINVDSVGVGTFREGIFLPDNKMAKFGNTAADPDLEIYHGGTASYISHTGTGNLYIHSNTVALRKQNQQAYFVGVNGQSKLYESGNERLATTSSGVSITGNANVTGQVFSSYATLSAVNPTLTFSDTDNNPDYTINLNSGILKITDSTNTADRIVVNSTGVSIPNDLDVDGHTNLDNVSIAGVTTFADGVAAKFGTDGDLQVYHTGSNSIIRDQGTGTLSLQSNGTEIALYNYANSQYMGKFANNAQVELYYAGLKKFETRSNGINVTGRIFCDGTAANNRGLIFNDNVKISLGSSNDLEIFHDGNHSRIKDAGTGDLVLISNTISLVNAADSETLAQFKENGSVDLYYDNTKRIETTGVGANVIGNFVADCSASIDPDSYTSHFITGGIQDGSGWSAAGIAFGAGTGHMAAMGSNGSRLYMAYGNGSVNGLKTFLDVGTNGELHLNYQDSQRLRTTSTGVVVTGTLNASGIVGITSSLNVTGITSISSQYSLQPFTVIGGSHPTPGYTHRNQFVFKTSHGHTDLKFENSYGGNWYGGSVSHTRILWEAYGERGGSVPGGDYGKLGEFCSIQPLNTTPGAFNSLIFKGNDGVAGLSTMCRMYTDKQNFYVHGNLTTQIGQVGLGVTGNIYHINDFNSGYTAYDTYFGFPQNNQFHLVCNGTEKFRVDSNWARFQNLSQGLIINSNVDLNGDIDVDGHTNLDNVNIAGVTTTGNLYADNLYAQSSLTINSNSNVSVNLTSTSTTGSSRIFFGDPDSALVGRLTYTHNGDYMQFYTAYGERLRITHEGKFSLGNINATPSAALHLDWDTNNMLMLDNNSASTQKIQFANNASTHAQIFGTSASGGLTFDSDPSNNHNNSFLNFVIDGSTKAYINSSGQMGLGIVSPQANAKLQVVGRVGATEFYTTTTSSPQTDFTSSVSSNKAGLLLHRLSETNGDYGGLEFHNHPSSITSYRKGGIYYKTTGSGFGRGDIIFANDTAADANNVSPSDHKFVIKNDGSLRAYTNSNAVSCFSNSDHGNVDFNHRGGRVLTSNGTGWDGNASGDGSDPILVLAVENRAGNSDISDAYGLCLHSESQDDNDYGPLIGWSNRSNSGSYNTTYAAIVGQKTGQSTDANWSAGALHFFTAKATSGSGGYMTNEADMKIDATGRVLTPRQVSFYATANSGGTVSMTSTHTLTNWRLSTSGKTFDIGSNFNTSNGRFTAPVSGKYLFTGSILLAGYDQASDIHMMWRKNGTTMQYWYNTRTSDIDRSGYGGYLAQGSTTTFSLSANDYIDVACVFSGTLSLWCGDANWGHFSGHLLG